MTSSYKLRGQRVEYLTPDDVKFSAEKSIELLKIKPSTLRHMDKFIENLPNILPKFNVDIIDDSEWLGFADALYDPQTFTIAIPNSLYIKMVKNKDKHSAFIFFHELGHALLGHKPLLHHADGFVVKYEDAEWQADYFADVIMGHLGEHRHKQFELF